MALEENKELDSKTALLKAELNELKSKINDLQHDKELFDNNNDKISK